MKIAIQGHPYRGNEVIKILESLGGINDGLHKGNNPNCYYELHGNIIWCVSTKGINFKYCTLEEFEKEFPFKIGDKVITTDGTIGIIDKLKPGEDYPYCIKADVGGFYWCTISVLKSYKKMKEERNVTLTLEKAKEWYKKGGELKEVALQAYSEEELTKVELPKTWEEFCKNYPKHPGEAYINAMSSITQYNSKVLRQINVDENVCPSQKSAEAHLAMIQLEQLRNCWWGDWKPKWNSCAKYIIKWEGEDLIVFTARCVHAFLVFPTREMAEEFLECFRDLIEKARDLI